MRLCTSLSLCLTAAALLVPAVSDAAHADATPSCAAPGDRTFPLATRIHGGPASYEAGGDHGTWYIDLTNTTGRACNGVHPVIVLTDDKHTLKPSQPHLDFYDGARARPVRFESTDEQELVGVFDAEGFAGFTVAPGKTVTVKVRLALTADAAPEQVTANAAVVQRRGQDGEWIGESDDYRFAIAAADRDPDRDADRGAGHDQDGGGTTAAQDPEQPGGTRTGQAQPGETRSGQAESGRDQNGAARTGQPWTDEAGAGQAQDATGTAATPPGVATSTTPHSTASPSATPSTGGRTPGAALPLAQEAQEAGQRARELARTGLGLARGLLTATAVLLAVGGSAFLLSRRRR
ncbi:hypothetical protein [Streptomyces sp. NBC_00820]|uniref:hypothetical protein n=1 Tax=Streptomyces sp. NBC_00820 TaxID=2975842 RepID=UPI002ED521BC